MTINAAIRHDVCRTLLQRCVPFRFAAPWAFLPESPNILALPKNPAALFRDLRKHKFAVSVLVAMGIIAVQRAGKQKKSPRWRLAAPNDSIVVRRDADGEIVGVLTSAGDIWTRDVPALQAYTRSERSQIPESEPPGVYAMGSILDAAILRAIGIPATLGIGLESLSDEQIPRFAAAFNYVIPSPALPVARCRPATPLKNDEPAAPGELDEHAPLREHQLILGGWSPSRVSAESTPLVANVESRFCELHKRNRGDVLDQCFGWKPRPEFFAELQRAVKAASLRWVQRMLWDDLQGDMINYSLTFSLQEIPPKSVVAPEHGLTNVEPKLSSSLAEALAAIYAAKDDDAESPRLPGSPPKPLHFKHVLRLIDEQVIAPIIESGLKETDPIECARLIMASQVLRAALQLTMRLNRDMKRSLLPVLPPSERDRVRPRLILDVRLERISDLLREFQELTSERGASSSDSGWKSIGSGTHLRLPGAA